MSENLSSKSVDKQNSIFPVSFAQRRFWLLDQLEPNSIAYNIYSPVRLEGDLDVAALRKAFCAVIERHEPFRTKFCAVDSQPMQVIAPFATIEIPLLDLSQIPESKREAELMRLMQEDAQKPFDL